MKGTHLIKILSSLILFGLVFGMIRPAFADYLGPDRTRTESYVETYDWGVWAKPDPTGNSCHHTYGTDCVVCTWERTPGSPCGDATYWYKVGTRSEVVERTITYPEATISGTLNGCNARNGWCSTTPSLSLSASEPVTGYAITLIEGTRNGEVFACNGASCDIPLLEGENAFTFWALSSWGDSSRMGSLTARVDTRSPQIDGTLSGTPGEAGWYVSPVTFTASAFDPAPGSGIETFTYTWNASPETPYTAPLTLNDGVHMLTLRARDAAGHITELSQSAQVDTLAPQAGLTLSTASFCPECGQALEVLIQASDSGSGLEGWQVFLDGAPWQSGSQTEQAFTLNAALAGGSHTLRLEARDAAGNLQASEAAFFVLAPTPTAIPPAAPANTVLQPTLLPPTVTALNTPSPTAIPASAAPLNTASLDTASLNTAPTRTPVVSAFQSPNLQSNNLQSHNSRFAHFLTRSKMR